MVVRGLDAAAGFLREVPALAIEERVERPDLTAQFFDWGVQIEVIQIDDGRQRAERLDQAGGICGLVTPDRYG